MNEIVVNLHMHTLYSDGTGSHLELARAGIRCGLDAIIVTDHNVLPGGMERYHKEGKKRILVLVGEELHDRGRDPQKNHLLVLGAGQDLAPYADDTQALLAAVHRAGGLAFIAHPVDPAAPAFHEPDISWESWSAGSFTGLELWNGFSEFKSHLRSVMHGLVLAFFPALVARGPLPAAVGQWDRLLAEGSSVAIGGSDAHALRRQAGPLRRTLFPYDYHFRAVNTHVLLSEPLSGDAPRDASSIYGALASGRCFIGYDLPASTRGFRFTAHSADGEIPMGAETAVQGGVALHAWLPDFAEIRLYRDGKVITGVRRGQALTFRALEAGVYRIEARRRFLGVTRTWILSNAIRLT